MNAVRVLRPVPVPFAAWWLAGAVALIPPAEFLVRGMLGADVAAACASGVLLGGTLLALLLAPGRGWVARGGRPAAWLLAWIAAAAVSAAATDGWPEAIPIVAGLGAAAAILLVCSGWPGPAADRIRAWLGAGLVAGGALASCVALRERAVGPGLAAADLGALRALDPGMAGLVAARLSEGRAFAFFLYPNALAGFLILALPVAVQRWRSRGFRWLDGGLAAINLAGLVASGSIGGAACLASAALAATWRSARGRRGPAVLAGVAVAALGVILTIRPAGSLHDGASTKAGLWAGIVRGVASPGRLLAGTGPGRFADRAGGRLPEGLRARSAHNWLLETLAEEGLAGAVCWIGFIGALLGRWWSATGGPASARGPEPWDWGWSVAWLAGLLHALVDIDYLLPAVAFPWWAISGLLAASGLPGRSAAAGPRRPAGDVLAWLLLGGVWLSALTRGPSAVAVEGAVCGAAVAWVALRRMLASAPPASGRDLPWILVAAAGWGWVVLAAAPAPAYRVALEATGLLAAGWVARSVVHEGGDDHLERGVRWTAILLGAGACLEALATGRAAAAVFPSPNFLATFLVAGLGLSLARIARPSAARSGRWPDAAEVAVLAAGLAATRSSGAALAATVIGGWWGLTRFPGGRWARAAAGLAALLVLGAVVVPRVDALSLVQRGVIWREGARLLAGEPFGRGPGTYGMEARRVQAPSVTTAGVAQFSLVAEFAHCDPLQFAVEWGLPALGLLGWGLWSAAAGSRRGGSAWWWCAAAMGLHSLTDFPFRAPALDLLGAIAVGAASAGGTRRSATPVRRLGPDPWGARLAVAAAALAGLAWIRPAAARLLDLNPPALIPAEYAITQRMLAVWPLSVEGHLRAARVHTAACEVTGAWRGGGGAAAAEELETAVVLGGGAGDARMRLGEFLLTRAERLRRPEDLARAREVFSAESASAPRRPQPWIGLARAWLADRQPARADACLLEALAREPFALEALALRGLAAERRGDRTAARRFYRQTLLLREIAMQRAGLNAYELNLIDVDVSRIRGRLLDLGGA